MTPLLRYQKQNESPHISQAETLGDQKQGAILPNNYHVLVKHNSTTTHFFRKYTIMQRRWALSFVTSRRRSASVSATLQSNKYIWHMSVPIRMRMRTCGQCCVIF